MNALEITASGFNVCNADQTDETSKLSASYTTELNYQAYTYFYLAIG